VSAPTLPQVFARSDRMVGRRIAGEYVVVPLAGRGVDLDAILNLNRVAAFIWERLDGQRSGQEIAAAMAAQFEVDVETAGRDYLELLGTLRELKAVHLVTAATPAR
jgi:hypothetical protein